MMSTVLTRWRYQVQRNSQIQREFIEFSIEGSNPFLRNETVTTTFMNSMDGFQVFASKFGPKKKTVYKCKEKLP